MMGLLFLIFPSSFEGVLIFLCFLCTLLCFGVALLKSPFEGLQSKCTWWCFFLLRINFWFIFWIHFPKGEKLHATSLFIRFLGILYQLVPVRIVSKFGENFPRLYFIMSVICIRSRSLKKILFLTHHGALTEHLRLIFSYRRVSLVVLAVCLHAIDVYVRMGRVMNLINVNSGRRFSLLFLPKSKKSFVLATVTFFLIFLQCFLKVNCHL